MKQRTAKRWGAMGVLAMGAVWGCSANGVEVRAQGNEAQSEAAKTQLRAQIKTAGEFAEAKYGFSSWNAMREAMNAARSVADDANATPVQVLAASDALQQKIAALRERLQPLPASPTLALSASLFATKRQGALNNVALMWAATVPVETVELQRAKGKSRDFARIYSGRGASFHDVNLPNGTYAYRLVSRSGDKTLISNVQTIKTTPMPSGLKEYSNQTGAGGPLWEPLKIGKTFYAFDGKRDDKTVRYIVKTSTDGKNWKEGSVVLDASDHPDLDDFKFESGTIFYDKARDRIVWWCHWERSGPRYGDGRAFVATAKPGGRFKVHHIYRPLGVQVRDMSVFIDDDKQGYLVAASNIDGQGANATLYIFKLNADYTDVTGITNKAMEDGYREAPHIIKNGGSYYLFFSQAAGWFPSRAGYITSPTLDGAWSEVRYIGNTSTFSAQSGGILDYGDGKAFVPVLMANRWIRGEGTSGNAVVPLHAVGGFALGDYAPTLLVNAKKDLIVPLYEGELLSQDRPATASIAGTKDHDASKAFDGDYTTSFQSDDRKWPFNVTVDLGAPRKIRNVQISWHLHKGSEAYYKYTIDGSDDGQNWRVLLDRTDDKNTLVSKTYGFSSDLLTEAPSARYVRINVQNAVLHNNPNNWYPPTLYEVKIFGDKS